MADNPPPYAHDRYPGLMCLRNDHLKRKVGLILPELEPEVFIPWRYERKVKAANPIDGGMMPSSVYDAPLSRTDRVLKRFSQCGAIYA
jgi:hypothetical protein